VKASSFLPDVPVKEAGDVAEGLRIKTGSK